MQPPDGVEVVIPLRWDGDAGRADDVAELGRYLAVLSRHADVTVVDGSPAPAFERHARAWGPHARHVPPAGRRGANGKVVGALTGVEISRHERIVLADDDVRYDVQSLRQVTRLLDAADLVRPANIFSQWPWHARWDGARSLLNRALAADWPGTFAVRRSSLLAVGGWDADVMFENLELVRTVQAAGGVVIDAPHVLVDRRPPSARQFVDQRVRQAYDDLAQPWRLTAGLLTLPLAVVAGRRRPLALIGAAAALVTVAEVGRRTAGARPKVPATASLFAPVWVAERGVCSWLALWARARGGVRYRGRRLRGAAHSRAQIARRLSDTVQPSTVQPSTVQRTASRISASTNATPAMTATTSIAALPAHPARLGGGASGDSEPSGSGRSWPG